MMNRKHVRNILERLTNYLEEKSGLGSHYLEYIGATGKTTMKLNTYGPTGRNAI